MKELSKENIGRLFEGFKYRHLILSMDKDSYYRPIINDKLIQMIQDEGTPELLDNLIEQIKEESPEDYSEDWLTDFTGFYDIENFLLRHIEAGAIIHHVEIPSKIISLFGEMKDCYMFGLYNATIIFCRAILEECLKRHYTNRNSEIPMELNELIEKADLPEELKKEAHKIRKEANSILHRAKIQNSLEIQEKALSAIRSTTLVVEKLFI